MEAFRSLIRFGPNNAEGVYLQNLRGLEPQKLGDLQKLFQISYIPVTPLLTGLLNHEGPRSCLSICLFSTKIAKEASLLSLSVLSLRNFHYYQESEHDDLISK